MAVEIRIMNSNDYPYALDLWKSLPGLGLSSADEQAAINSFLNKNPDTCFVAVDGSKIIGAVLGGSDGRRGYLYHLAVDKTYQKKGVGRQLIESCLAALKSQGLKKCHIFVISSNLEGLRFWEKSGWLVLNDIIVMSKDL